jgi:hypothetical protein
VKLRESDDGLPHVAQDTSGRRPVVGATPRHSSIGVPERIRERRGRGFGWAKTVAGCAIYHREMRNVIAHTIAASS